MKEKVRATYENRPEGVPERREIKDEDGNVMTAEPNMKTMPMKKGKFGKNIYFQNKIEYIADDYNVTKKIATKEREYHLSKL